MNKKLSIEDLRKNMIVRTSQLDEILNVYMILVDTELTENNDVQGTLVYFGDGNSDEYSHWFNQNKPITPVYFDSMELEDGEVYEE